MKILIIGGTGFVGNHIQNRMSERYEITATGTQDDIRNYETIRNLIKSKSPDYVINLASLTTVKETIENPMLTYDIGFTGTLNILNALKETGFNGRMLQISSSEVYGHPVPKQLPIRETEPFRPQSPYAVCKTAAEMLCYQWSQTELFEIVRVRPFTHIGPGQSERFAIANFARQIAEIKTGKKNPVIKIGNLDATRDFTDVRDVVDAYEMLLLGGANGDVYNVCSSREIQTGELLERMIKYSGKDIDIIRDESLMRPTEHQRVLGSNQKIDETVGWQPKISLDKTVADTIDYWIDTKK